MPKESTQFAEDNSKRGEKYKIVPLKHVLYHWMTIVVKYRMFAAQGSSNFIRLFLKKWMTTVVK